jgi:hypothetical protein
MMATNKHLDVRSEGRDSVINMADDDLKNLSFTIIAARGNRFLSLPEQQFHTNGVNTFHKYVLHYASVRVCASGYSFVADTNKSTNTCKLSAD